ncbi:PilC/PilY family type IV pilus protein [Zestomonas carbonaria]|uniref:Type IV pilus assembly protein PilY1 n=1 Tax=Zestomonas carbonaria TaxID=2762745 RepID=A0A7U7EQ57_9GAMM|nr:PilC/PilY family type IV pilus protein [Pseudomonas carbonaria]CAD5109035.1 hypothetical protein PSEWESI4_03331 [Pseudomonas carbonaria]
MKAPNFLCSALASTLATALVLYSGISYADDTEIFFGGSAIDAGIRPNVLFILDDSGSMNDRNTPTRMAQLKTAFSSIINNAGSINVGVMALNSTTGGSRLLSPVRPIDESVNVKLSNPVLLASGDDASYSSNGTTNISDPTLVMGYTGNSEQNVTRSLGTGSSYSAEYSSYYVVRSGGVDYACSSKIAAQGTVCPSGTKATINSTTGSSGNDGILLFRNLNVPAGVTITAARLVVTRASTSTGTVRPFSVKIENTKTAAAFNNDDTIGSDRDFGNTNLNIATVTPDRNGEELTFNLTTQFQNLRGLPPSDNPIADVALRLRGTGSNSYSWYLGDGTTTSPEHTPRLEIEWTGSTDINRTTGLRFQNVAIPKGATITSARIDFVPAASDDRPVTFSITAQNIADAPIFTANASNFTGRVKTSNSATWTPAEWRTSSPQVYVEGPTVTALVQSVINSNADWCGNNSMAFFITPTSGTGSRTTFSVDAAKDLQPVLNVTYEGGEDGCLDPILDISVIDAKDDGYQAGTSSSTRTPNLTSTTLSFSNGYIASRYQKVPVKQGATVKEAQIIVTPNNTNSGNATVYIEDVNNSAELTTNRENISNRFPSSGGATCSFAPVAAGVPITCSAEGIKTQLQNLFARSGWADGNALSLLIRPSSGSLAVRSRDYGAGSSITLRVKLASGGLGENSYTIRDYTNGIVQGLSANGYTPIVPALYEAAGYLAQKPGKHIGNVPSPITSSCQANYLVLLTDGEANTNPSSAQTAAQDGIASLIGSSCSGDSTYSSEKCGRSVVQWLATEDQADYDGLNTVTTHTIGFNTSSNNQATTFLNNLASLGGGKAYQAENAADLANAFDDIVQAALATNTTFVNTSAPVNSFNRADNLDELYFALFRPSETDRWAGNLKRYRLKTEGTVATIVDADDAAAIDGNTGFFKSSARSFWSATQDGSDISKGGAGFKLPEPANRKLFTYLGNSPAGTPAALESLISTNTNITAERLGDSSMTTVERANLLKYIRGVDTDDSGNDTNRQALGDPIHSSPRLVTYGCNTYANGECTSPDLSAIMGTNEGFIHAFNTSTGVEQFAFMPEALLPNIKQLRANAKSSSTKPRLYGMDNTVTLWVNDANNNGVIYGDPSTGTTTGLNTGEFVYAYATMGRGGRNIYALDITNRNEPKMLWQILGGTTTGFEKLAQTWSAPVKTRIKVGSTIRDVLIFAGGYDKDQDDLNTSTSVYAQDDIGNAIYIVDAKTGEKIWSVSNSSGHDLILSKMKYSIPSGVRVIDIQEANGVLVTDPDKLADQFFVGDMGGQVWRFYINNGQSGAGLVTAAGTSGDGVFATIGGTTTESARRFYHEPDVALLNINGSRSLVVNIGSGYRGHPLNEYIVDRFYSFRTSALFKTTGEGTLTEAHLYDATLNLVQAGDATQKSDANNAFRNITGGWYITLTNSGEKVLSRALTVGGELYFNTYEPSTSTAACSATVGKNRSYRVRLLDATPASVPVNGNGTPGDRSDLSNSGGISGDPQLFCSGNDCWVLPDPSLDPVKANMPPLGKTYWMDSADLD